MDSRVAINPIKVFIVDDHAVVRDGLTLALSNEGDLKVVGESDGLDREVALLAIEESRPDIVLLDIKLGKTESFELGKELKALVPSIRIVMLTGFDTELYASEALTHFANGFVTKECSKEFLCAALRVVALGASVWQENMLFQAVRSLFHIKRADSLSINLTNVSTIGDLKSSLSQRELNVLTALSKGASNKQIGRLLNLSEITIKQTIHGIFKKFGISHRSQAAVLANKIGLA
ncbi:response regulator transcription factor [Dehalococcoides mccartyi]|uniref:response regulator transcription factor n=1 Tax=Dehalococcoides mccartyi TaxID=61435 RepID=UPI000805C41E|nr:response regulator transcription factor [Dehalococcoides mccartyi]OBW61065.1 MAG: hypothetical protein A9181_07180 [Dehalococcoides mccartyi]OBW62556.1 MAG: hypothetical protein A9183_07645 [Dehalococcoides mccartyi]